MQLRLMSVCLRFGWSLYVQNIGVIALTTLTFHSSFAVFTQMSNFQTSEAQSIFFEKLNFSFMHLKIYFRHSAKGCLPAQKEHVS